MKWIDIKKQKPPKHKFVLCYNKHSGLEVSRDNNYSFKDVTHWMPLPLNPDGSETASAYQKSVKNCYIPTTDNNMKRAELSIKNET